MDNAKNRKIKPDEMALLKEVILKTRPSLLPALNDIGVTPLTEHQREEIIDIISDEFVSTGLDNNDEPNSRGLQLENLIDVMSSHLCF